MPATSHSIAAYPHMHADAHMHDILHHHVPMSCYTSMTCLCCTLPNNWCHVTGASDQILGIDLEPNGPMGLCLDPNAAPTTLDVTPVVTPPSCHSQVFPWQRWQNRQLAMIGVCYIGACGKWPPSTPKSCRYCISICALLCLRVFTLGRNVDKQPSLGRQV